jgi:hypothetical protein
MNGQMSPDPIVVYGAPRSGTTYLQELINSHPEVYVSHETRVFAWLHEAIEVLTGDDRLVANQREEFISYLRRVAPELMRGFYRELAPGVSRWGDKNPHYVDPLNDGALELVAEIFPRALFIHIVRDGRDVVSSLLRKEENGKPWVTFDQAHYTWGRHVQRGSEFGRSLGGDARFLELRYEDLVADDLAMADRIFSFIGIELHPDVREFCRRQANERTPFKAPTRDLTKGVTASDWATLLTPEQQERSLGLIGESLVRYGYETEESLAGLRKRVAQSRGEGASAASVQVQRAEG